jgi:methylase of polypeptide subunit release factors
MTKLLKQAFKKASELPGDLQDELARELLLDMQAEQKWDQTLVESQDMLDSLAKNALEQHKAGHTKQMGPDEL